MSEALTRNFSSELDAIEEKQSRARRQLALVEGKISVLCRKQRRTGSYADADTWDALCKEQRELKDGIAALDAARQKVGRDRKEINRSRSIIEDASDERRFIDAAKEVLPDALYMEIWKRVRGQ